MPLGQPTICPYVSRVPRRANVMYDSGSSSFTLPTGGDAASVIGMSLYRIEYPQVITGVEFYPNADVTGAGTARLSLYWFSEDPATAFQPKGILDANLNGVMAFITGGADGTAYVTSNASNLIPLSGAAGNAVYRHTFASPSGILYPQNTWLGILAEGTFSAGSLRSARTLYGGCDFKATNLTYSSFTWDSDPTDITGFAKAASATTDVGSLDFSVICQKVY